MTAPRDYSLTGPEAARAAERGLAKARWYQTPLPREQLAAPRPLRLPYAPLVGRVAKRTRHLRQRKQALLFLKKKKQKDFPEQGPRAHTISVPSAPPW